MVLCPCCKTPLPAGIIWSAETGTLIIDDRVLDFKASKRRQSIVFDALYRAALEGRGVAQRKFIDIFFAHDPDGGPLTAVKVIKQYMSKLRKTLRGSGFTVKNIADTYFLLPGEAPDYMGKPRGRPKK